jgi:hypothetical protein
VVGEKSPRKGENRMGEAGTAASASTSTYGSIDQRPSGEVSAARQTRAKQSVMSKAAPFIVLAVLGVMSVLVSFLGKADRQIDQVLFLNPVVATSTHRSILP